MTIRNPVLFGLKVAFNFADARSKSECLINLGLDIRDLNVIRGISNRVDKLDLQNVSGLDVNLTRYLDRLKSDTRLYSGIVNPLGGYQYTLQGNMEAFGPLSGGAVRYKYIPNDAGTGLTKNNLKFGDISTSRVSAWSADGEDNDVPISYGASVQIRGVLKLGQKGNFAPASTEALINVLDTPEPIRFATEVATDVLEIELNGNTKYIYAMRGIPIVFTTAFKSLSMDFEISSRPEGNPTYTIQATDKSESEVTSIPPVAGGTSRLRYNAPSYKERFIKLYYPPKSVTSITASSLNIRYLPAVKFFELRTIKVQNNLLGEMPDWRDITYSYDRINPQSTPLTNLTYIDVSNNPLNLTDDEEMRQFGTNVVERLPKGLVTYYASGTYNAHTEFKTLDESCVIKCTPTEYSNIAVDPESTQDYNFQQILDINNNQAFTTNVKGIFYDKQVHPTTSVSLVYVKNPVLTKNSSWLPISGIDNVETNADWLTIVNGGIFPNYATYFLPLNMATRCPGLQTFYMRNSGGKRIYRNSNTRGPLQSGVTKFVEYQTSQEFTPQVDLETITTYDVYDNSYTKLSEIFTRPTDYLPQGAVSSLRTFNVGENESLSEIADSLDFRKMSSIESINIYDTSLPIPANLDNNTSLKTLTCSYTKFPARIGTPTGGPYTKAFEDINGNVIGYIDPVTGDGNPSGATNHLFNTKFPVSESEYALSGCSNLSKLSFYSSRLDGMIPKFVGNDNLSSIDFRYTRIEGGRPADLSSGLSGRRYVMWDDTFEDAPDIKSIRIRSGNLGRNIGIFTPSATGGTYTEASFEGGAFNLNLLETLDIVSTNQLLRGTFFNTGGAPSLKVLRSPSSGWGLDLPNGAPFPAFSNNTNLEEIDLSDNNFSGQIALSGLSNLKKFYANNNRIEGIDSANFSGLGVLQYFVLSNNRITGQIPNFSTNAPNVEYISLNNNDYGSSASGVSPFTSGLLAQCEKLKSLDLSNNGFNSSTIDDILLEMLANYNNSQRTGVVVNLGGNNAAPSAGENLIPTTTSSTQTEVITVGEQVPGNEQFTFFNPQDFSINIKNGQDPNNTNLSYTTVIKQNGTDITSLLSINYANEVFTFPVTPPSTGDVLEITVTTITQGFITEETGGIVTLKQLRNLNWIITCNNPPTN